MQTRILIFTFAIVSQAMATSSKTFSFTAGLACQDQKILLGFRQSEMAEENKNQVLLWDLDQEKVLQKLDLPEPNRDIVAIYPSRTKEEVFLLSQTRHGGSDKPSLWKLNLSTKTFTTIQGNVDCAEIKSVQALRGRLDFQCGLETPTPPKRKKFSLYVKGLESNKGKLLSKGLKMKDWVLVDVKTASDSEVQEFVWEQKGPRKSLKASEGL